MMTTPKEIIAKHLDAARRLFILRRFDEAEKEFASVLETARKYKGSVQEYTHKSLHGLATCAQAQDKIKEAKLLYEMAARAAIECEDIEAFDICARCYMYCLIGCDWWENNPIDNITIRKEDRNIVN